MRYLVILVSLLILSPNSRAAAPSLKDLTYEICALKDARIDFSDDVKNIALTTQWRDLHIKLESLFAPPELTNKHGLYWREQINQCATTFTNNAFSDIKNSNLKFGRLAINKVVFWASRLVNLNSRSIPQSKPTQKSVEEIARFYLSDAYGHLLAGTTYTQLVQKIHADAKRAGFDRATTEGAIQKIAAELEDHVVFNGVEIKEGDMLLLFDDHALGDLAYPMIGVENLLGHAAMIFSGRLGPVKTYYVAEVIDKIKYSKLADYSQSVVIRPKSFSLKGRSEQLVRELQTRPFRFDAKFHDDMLNEDGSAFSLYCAKFIHYAYKNGFSTATALTPSPFDYVDFHIDGSNSFLVYNDSLLGITPTSHVYLPEQLFFNRETELVGVLRYPTKLTIHPNRLRLGSELEEAFYAELRHSYLRKTARDFSWFELRSINAQVWLVDVLGVYDLSNVDFPAGDGKYYFFKFLSAVSTIRKLAPLSMDPLTPADEVQIRKDFERRVMSDVYDMFN